MSLALHHLAHLLFCLNRHAGSGGEFTTDDVLLLTVKRDIRVGHELDHVLAVFLQHEGNEGLRQRAGLTAGSGLQQHLLLGLVEHGVVDGLTKHGHISEALAQCHHLLIDLVFELSIRSALQECSCIPRRDYSNIHTLNLIENWKLTIII